MHRQGSSTSFLNVDLDIRGDAGDVETFIRSIADSVVVLHHVDQVASIELVHESLSLDETVMAMVEFVEALPPDLRHIWDQLALRSLNVGIQAGGEPYSACFGIAAKTVELVAALGFEIVFTVYAPRGD